MCLNTLMQSSSILIRSPYTSNWSPLGFGLKAFWCLAAESLRHRVSVCLLCHWGARMPFHHRSSCLLNRWNLVAQLAVSTLSHPWLSWTWCDLKRRPWTFTMDYLCRGLRTGRLLLNCLWALPRSWGDWRLRHQRMDSKFWGVPWASCMLTNPPYLQELC